MTETTDRSRSLIDPELAWVLESVDHRPDTKAETSLVAEVRRLAEALTVERERARQAQVDALHDAARAAAHRSFEWCCWLTDRANSLTNEGAPKA